MTHLDEQKDSLAHRGPLRVLFMLTSMPVGGAETLLINLIRRLDRNLIEPEICCLKEPGPLGDEMAAEVPVHANFIRSKTDFRVVGRLSQLMKERQIDAIVTVGAGDKMFWGRLAAWRAGVPVITSALHSTGWPDGIGWLNHRLTPITDGFIACAGNHGKHLVRRERLPQQKVFVIPNGIDTHRFQPHSNSAAGRDALDLPANAKLMTIVAALRPEKNHSRFLRIASEVRKRVSDAEFLIVGDGPERPKLETLARELDIEDCVHFLGSRSDIPELLAVSDLFALTSDNEASPVSIMEAMACGLPVVASDVGSIPEMVIDSVTGYCVPKTDESQFADRICSILACEKTQRRMARSGRIHVEENGSLEVMVSGYEQLLAMLYFRKLGQQQSEDQAPTSRPEPSAAPTSI